MTTPLVSVLLPVYNAEPYLAAAIESILRQDHQRLEVIVIDDGSRDRSLEIMRRYQQIDARITIVSRENRGLIATLNEGLALAKGDLIARMDADDISYPSRLSRQVSLFVQQPELAICGTGIDTLFGDRIIRGTPNPIYQPASLRALSKFFTIFIHSTVVYNRHVIPPDMLNYDNQYVHAEDFDLFRRVTDHFPARMLDEALIAYRIHGNSVTNTHKRQMRRTHLAIVAENLERERLCDDPSALNNIGLAVTSETIRQAAGCVRSLEDRISVLPPGTRAGYEAGTLNLFYFLYQLVSDERRPELTHEFLTLTDKWGLIRRRERYGLITGARAPWCSRISLAASRRLDSLSRYRRSVPAASVLPPEGVR